jgi:molybdopterin-containing oxidoreductase family membrane subunit
MPSSLSASEASGALAARERKMREINDRLAALVLDRKPSLPWLAAVLFSGLLTLGFLAAIVTVLAYGVGLFGVNIPVAWAFPIVNTIWWIGMAHAGTLISAVLLLTRQPWRAPVNRFAEAMAMFAVVQAGIFPLLHLGRPWFFYFLVPYPDTMKLWPQWRSPLVWDFFAIATYLLYTMTFLYTSLLPDIATLRDKARSRAGQIFYGLLALGWRNSTAHWHRYQQATLVLAALAAPIVASVTGTISLDLSVSIVPGYHFTIFPPYFVAGAIYSGFATVIIIAVIVRGLFGITDIVTTDHIEKLARLMLAFGLVVDYSYIMEMFTAWYSAADYYQYVYIDRWTGPYAPFWWAMIFCNVFVLQLLWFRRVRRRPMLMLVLAIVGDLGMWLERYQIVLTSTHADYVPSSWDTVWPTPTDYAVQFGSIGAFFFLLLLFIRYMPPIAIRDMREMVHDEG